jgi:hypothetical protein
MFPIRILLLTDNNIRAYRWKRNELSFDAEFQGGDSPDLEGFEKWLRQERRVPLFIVADVIELDFRYETIPHAVLNEGRQLRQRKLNTMYRATPFRHALKLGREHSGRRDDQVLFSAITNPEALAPWLPIINKQKAPLAGICAPPLLLAKVGKTLEHAHTLLATYDSHAGLRLTYFFNGELRFSRLTPHFLDTPEELAPILVEEVARTQQYLLNLKLIGRDDALHICIADHSPQLERWNAALQSTRLLQFEAISLSNLAKRAGGREFKEGNSSAQLLAILAAQGFSQNHYGSGPYVHEAYLRLLRITTQATVVALAAMGVLIIGNEALTLYDLDSEIQQFNDTTQQTQKRYQQIKSAFPPAPANAADMQEADSVVKQLQNEKRAPQELLSQISQALDSAPAIRLTKLTWTYGRPQDSTLEESQGSAAARTNAASPPPNTEASTEAANEKKWHALIEGEIPASIKQREALAAVDTATKQLLKKGVSVEALRLPYNIRPDAPLEGKSGNALQQTHAVPTFALRVVWDSPANQP